MKDQVEGLGARIVFVGNGSAQMAKAFQEDFKVTAPVYTDPSLGAYRALGFRKGGSVLKALKAAPRALFGGHLQGRVQGDAMQLGGVFVVDRGGQVLYEHKSDAAGDHPPNDAILAALSSGA